MSISIAHPERYDAYSYTPFYYQAPEFAGTWELLGIEEGPEVIHPFFWGRLKPEYQSRELTTLDLLFTCPPHAVGEFVDAEIDGASVDVGEWQERGSYHVLSIQGIFPGVKR